MFKKLKDKLAEEVKSSPQRIQQFAQAAQAAVTSASSSISDITNADLFSIGDNDKDHAKPSGIQKQQTVQSNTYQRTSLMQPALDNNEDLSNFFQDNDSQRQRRLSNSSFASDVSFRLPSYESPSMYQLQSDMDVSASEADERGFSSGTVSLDRVTKEQIYSAYKRTQERYVKYRTQYADLVRHYKLLERENTKARSVLVETQDKALRRISELREQCALEQSAKAHLEKALREEIEEKNIQIDTLKTKIQLLKNSDGVPCSSYNEAEVQLVNLTEDENKPENKTCDALVSSEITTLNNKIDKLEQLINKYKESLKSAKEKNSQITSEMQIISNKLENKNKENEELKTVHEEYKIAKVQMQELTDLNEKLQNQINAYDFNKLKEISTLEIELEKSQEEIKELRSKIDVFVKNEEEYAISLAENKLSIHKELESKENEIKSLKDSLSATQNEIQSLNIVIEDYKKRISQLNDEKINLNSKINELSEKNCKVNEYESQMQLINQKYQALDNTKAKAEEEIKCLHLQLKQETAEKLAMVDRNNYLETKNSQLLEDNSKKSSQIADLHDMVNKLKEKERSDSDENKRLMEDLKMWKTKYFKVESEIQDEKSEFIKLQLEIENLISNHELLTAKNVELNEIINNLNQEIATLQENNFDSNKQLITKLKNESKKILAKINGLKQQLQAASKYIIFLKESNIEQINSFKEGIGNLLSNTSNNSIHDETIYEELKNKYESCQKELLKSSEELTKIHNELTSLQTENNNLQLTLVSTQNELNDINNKYEYTTKQIALLQNDNEAMQRMKQQCHKLESEINNFKNEKLSFITQVEELNKEKSNNSKLIQEMEHKTEILKEEYQNAISVVKQENEALKEQLTKLSENDKLIDSLKNEIKLVENENFELKNELLNLKNEKTHHSEEIVEKNRELVNENLLLKIQSDKILLDIKELENELTAVKTSHAQIEVEKDNLNSVIKLLEEKETEHKDSQTVWFGTDNRESQTTSHDTLGKYTSTEVEELEKKETEHRHSQTTSNETFDTSTNTEIDKSHEYKIEQRHTQTVSNNTEHRHSQTASNETSNKFTNTEIEEMPYTRNTNVDVSEALSGKEPIQEDKHKNDNADKCNELKAENRRLQSEIKGLQTYLANISKENSLLNEKLREVMVSGEHFLHQNQNMTETKNNNMWNKIEELTRENTLLIDENLELKDQLVSQNKITFTTTSDDEISNLKERYNTLLNIKTQLEKRVTELEDMSNSVNGNMVEMQENNLKLRKSNEKLERRLDEALVSLRHLHSLQENTELEYLRNILYEYLTGSGTHSITLAKVLAAVVKFDEKQTQCVLQKEKERQGLLRQLGLL